MAAAVAERQFLAEVNHPNIVEIYNFAQYDGSGYIVMEYVGGSRSATCGSHREETAARPAPRRQAIAYIVEILPALGYLHGRGLLYCDFKPDNVMQAGDNLKLIDLGGVRRLDDDPSAILRHGRLPGPRGRRQRPVRSRPILHHRADAGRARAWSSAATRTTLRHDAPAGRGRAGCSSATSRSTACW